MKITVNCKDCPKEEIYVNIGDQLGQDAIHQAALETKCSVDPAHETEVIVDG